MSASSELSNASSDSINSEEFLFAIKLFLVINI
jgi:hypothetical protein